MVLEQIFDRSFQIASRCLLFLATILLVSTAFKAHPPVPAWLIECFSASALAVLVVIKKRVLRRTYRRILGIACIVGLMGASLRLLENDYAGAVGVLLLSVAIAGSVTATIFNVFAPQTRPEPSRAEIVHAGCLVAGAVVAAVLWPETVETILGKSLIMAAVAMGIFGFLASAFRFSPKID
ncbi:MAG TPA: hypothetical protein VL137_01985, partial [Polyangiaceae bacterium]|nr:hypothetical protein [Polyangiaceae bacterium]